MNKKQPEALRLAEMLTADEWPGSVTLASYARECVAELRRLHAENETLRAGYAAARLEIESLRKEHADELAVAYMCEASREKELAAQQGAAYAAQDSEHQLAIMEGERNASLDAYSRVVSITSAESRLYEAGFTNGWDRRDRLVSHGQAPAPVLHLVNDAFAEVAMAYPKAFALHKVGLADTAVREALAVPSPHAAQQAPAQAAPAAVAGPIGYGPKVTVRRSCSDCKACNSESYAVQGDSGHYVYCEHPSLPDSKYIGDTNWNTPHWCPVSAPTTQPAPQQEAQEPVKLSDEQIKAHGDKASRMMARDLTRFDAACEVDKYLREQGAPGYYRHRMSIVLFGNVEGTEAARAPDTAPQPSPAAQGGALDAERWHWIAEYLVGPRTDLDDEIVASETVNELRKLVDDARAAQEGTGGQVMRYLFEAVMTTAVALALTVLVWTMAH